MRNLLSSSYQQPQSPTVRRLPLRENFAWTFVGNAVYSLCQWGMLTVLAKLGSAQVVGQFSLGTAITAPIFMLTNLQLRALQVTDARSEYEFGDYLGLRLLTLVLAMLVTLGTVLFSDYATPTAWVIIIIGLSKSLESIGDIIHGLFQKYERLDKVALSLVYRGLLSLLLLGGFTWLTDGNLIYGVLGLALAWLIVLLVYDLPCVLPYAKPWPRFNPHTLWRLVRLTAPLGLVMMLISLKTNIPRYFIERYWTEQELGYFSATAYLMVAGSMVVRALGQSSSPRLARYNHEHNARAFARLMLQMLALGAVLGLGSILLAIFAGRPLLTVLYRPDYAEYVDVFISLMIAAALTYLGSFLGYGMTAARYFKAQVPISLAVVVATVVASALLVPRSGAMGGAQAMIIGAGINCLGALAVNIHALKRMSDLKHQETSCQN